MPRQKLAPSPRQREVLAEILNDSMKEYGKGNSNTLDTTRVDIEQPRYTGATRKSLAILNGLRLIDWYDRKLGDKKITGEYAQLTPEGIEIAKAEFNTVFTSSYAETKEVQARLRRERKTADTV